MKSKKYFINEQSESEQTKLKLDDLYFCRVARNEELDSKLARHECLLESSASSMKDLSLRKKKRNRPLIC